MRTPIADFVRGYAQSGVTRLHMPGHKGEGSLGVEALDITEVEGADVLYHEGGILRESQENATRLFGTAKTLYSTEGSSLSIRAMLYLATLNRDSSGERPLVLAGRNAHKSFVSAAALMDLDVAWILPHERGALMSCPITPKCLEDALSALPRKPIAVYLTSPDYLGNVLDIRALSEVAHRHGVPILVDQAHGAYLQFLPTSRHAIAEGADLVCDSAHKTLSALTGAGYLHVGKCAPAVFFEQAERAMALFASTSPSYLILTSLDLLNRTLFEDYSEKLLASCERVAEVKKKLTPQGYTLIGDEPLKLTISTKPYGYVGEEMAKILGESGIVCEFADRDFLVMMFTPALAGEGYDRLEHVLGGLPRRAPVLEDAPRLPMPHRVRSIREAIFSDGELLPLDVCEGRIFADAAIACPPAIPIVVAGERIDADALRCLRYYGIEQCRVVKE